MIKKIFSWLATKATTAVSKLIPFRFLGGQIVPYTDDKLTYIEKGYTKNDIIYSIINLITDTAILAPWDWYRVRDRKSYELMKSELRKDNPDMAKVVQLRKKSLELYTDNARLNQLFKYPNPTQTFSQLNKELWSYKLITGDYFEYWSGRPSGGLNGKIPETMSALPSQYMEIKASNTLPMYETGYQLNLGSPIPFEAYEVLHEKYPNLEWDINGTQLYGMAPLKAALRRLQKNNANQDSQTAAFENGGMRGIVSYDDERIDPSDRETFEQMGKDKTTFYNEMRPGPQGNLRTFFSVFRVKWQQMGFSPADMNQLESEKVDSRFFCSVWGVPSQLLNDDAAKTYNTTVEAEKALITRCVLPLLCDRRDSINRKMELDDIVADFDLTVYDQLQPNKNEIAEWVNKMPLTNARKLEIIGEDIPETMTQEERDAILIPSGLQLLSDVIAKPIEADYSAEINYLQQQTT